MMASTKVNSEFIVSYDGKYKVTSELIVSYDGNYRVTSELIVFIMASTK